MSSEQIDPTFSEPEQTFQQPSDPQLTNQD